MNKEISGEFVFFVVCLSLVSIPFMFFLWNMYGSWTTATIVDPETRKTECYVGQAKDEKGYYMYSNCPMYRIQEK